VSIRVEHKELNFRRCILQFLRVFRDDFYLGQNKIIKLFREELLELRIFFSYLK